MTQPAVVNYASEKHSVELREIERPRIGSDEVLVEVRAVGVCGSDLHQWMGTHSWPVNYPVVLGHEFGGVVGEVGHRVRGWREGDRVVSETAAVIDPDSPLTRQGLYNLDPARKGFGYGVDGAMTRWVRAPARCLHRIPDELPFDKAALTEPCSVAFNAVAVNSPVRPGDRVVVLGPGSIGLLCAAVARLHGAVVAVAGLEQDRARLEIARRYGCTPLFGNVKEWAMGWGKQPLGFSLDPLVQKNVRLQGSFSHNWPVWERVIGLLASGLLDPEPVIGGVWPLEEWETAFRTMYDGKIVKAVLKPAE